MQTTTPGTDQLIEVFQDLYLWAESKNFRGHDPHDLLEAPIFRRIPNAFARLVALQAGRRSPWNARGLLNVPAHENAKGHALFLEGLLQAQALATPNWQASVNDLTSRLLRLQHPSGGWGYPFGWQSRTHYIPKGSPNIVTTAFVGMALVQAYELEPRARVMDALRRAGDYVASLPVTQDDAGIAWGYAKNDPQVVFNASLLGAEFLVLLDRATGEKLFHERAHEAAAFVSHFQRADGSWIYGLEPSQTWIDSFHSGFVVCSLERIGSLLQDDALLRTAHKGFEYFVKTFLDSRGAIRYYSNALYPIDSHAMGQALITLTRFKRPELAQRVAQYAIDHLCDPQGYFYYQQHKRYTNKIAYMRWSNAWMFRGLAELLSR